MTHEYFAPGNLVDAFNCPSCGTYAEQNWSTRLSGAYPIPGGQEVPYTPANLSVAVCRRCHAYSVWRDAKLIHPVVSLGPLPHPDMPTELGIRDDYEEARSISSASPRGAAALLRLIIQKLCMHLGEKGDNLNTDIGSLVKKGLPQKIQRALDSVRVIGNGAVHPGKMDSKDDNDTVSKLFKLVNFIVENQIASPAEVDGIYESLPATTLEAIHKRDGSIETA